MLEPIVEELHTAIERRSIRALVEASHATFTFRDVPAVPLSGLPSLAAVSRLANAQASVPILRTEHSVPPPRIDLHARVQQQGTFRSDLGSVTAIC